MRIRFVPVLRARNIAAWNARRWKRLRTLTAIANIQAAKAKPPSPAFRPPPPVNWRRAKKKKREAAGSRFRRILGVVMRLQKRFPLFGRSVSDESLIYEVPDLTL